MSERQANPGLGPLALVPIACCIGIPLIAAAGLSVASAAWAGGAAIGALVLVALTALLAVRLRRPHRGQARRLSITRSRS
jgi:hypothetical protein